MFPISDIKSRLLRMKRFLAPILLLTLLFPSACNQQDQQATAVRPEPVSPALDETMEDLVKRDGLHFKKFSEVPFTGKTTGKKQVTFKNGKEHGPWVYYHDNGQLWKKGNYKNGEKEGLGVFHHQNGHLGSKGNYKNGKKHGPWVVYHFNGQLSSKVNWMGGKMKGPWVSYYDNGQLRQKGNFKNGKKHCSWDKYYHIGTLLRKQTTFKNGKKQGGSKLYYKDGHCPWGPCNNSGRVETTE
jgi:antitoxin component YwqK of YwqJK toxin-antitoxin module